ncbi:SAM-dependent methyltransferase [Amycolatopsis decaplanina]|uniref:S-adenosyl-L-methionine-dependent methyltransferase n=1 Tax=Amycolatopsis decaplanina DSM 44594 TaxID=1284240 RepID=M2YS05_9PSEU|nr:SAM-dependent methyltransferase [Amycolatopsis decaplanina]EME57647.1 methyltransferase [Amycolatopsis decaplanina DSM 44594]
MRPNAGLSEVGFTALVVALERYRESLRDDRLFADGQAELFVRAGFPSGLDSVPSLGERAPVMKDYMAFRTRYFDDWLTDATARHGLEQVVVLAAGLDSRSERLSLPVDIPVFEIDLPEIIDFKRRVLEQREETRQNGRVLIPADLRTAWPERLIAAGFDPGTATAWLVEGLLPYFSTEDNDRLLTRIGELSAPSSRLGAEHLNSVISRTARSGPAKNIAALWRSTVDDPAGWLKRHGWSAKVADPAELARLWSRTLPPVLDRAIVGEGRLWWVDAVK